MILELSSLSHSVSEKAMLCGKTGQRTPQEEGQTSWVCLPPCHEGMVKYACHHLFHRALWKPSLGAKKEMVPWERTSTSVLGISEKQDLLTAIQSAVHLQPIEGGGHSLTQNKHTRLLHSSGKRLLEGLSDFICDFLPRRNASAELF